VDRYDSLKRYSEDAIQSRAAELNPYAEHSPESAESAAREEIASKSKLAAEMWERRKSESATAARQLLKGIGVDPREIPELTVNDSLTIRFGMEDKLEGLIEVSTDAAPDKLEGFLSVYFRIDEKGDAVQVGLILKGPGAVDMHGDTPFQDVVAHFHTEEGQLALTDVNLRFYVPYEDKDARDAAYFPYYERYKVAFDSRGRIYGIHTKEFAGMKGKHPETKFDYIYKPKDIAKVAESIRKETGYSVFPDTRIDPLDTLRTAFRDCKNGVDTVQLIRERELASIETP